MHPGFVEYGGRDATGTAGLGYDEPPHFHDRREVDVEPRDLPVVVSGKCGIEARPEIDYRCFRMVLDKDFYLIVKVAGPYGVAQVFVKNLYIVDRGQGPGKKFNDLNCPGIVEKGAEPPGYPCPTQKRE